MADVVGRGSGLDGEQLAHKQVVLTRALAHHALRADGSQVALTELTHSATRPLLAVAAIAKPEGFFSMLRARGLKLTRTISLPDHYDFNSWLNNEYKDYTVICTEKDAVKLWRLQPDALAVPLVLTPEPAFLAALDALLATRLNPTLSSPHGHTTS